MRSPCSSMICCALVIEKATASSLLAWVSTRMNRCSLTPSGKLLLITPAVFQPDGLALRRRRDPVAVVLDRLGGCCRRARAGAEQVAQRIHQAHARLHSEPGARSGDSAPSSSATGIGRVPYDPTGWAAACLASSGGGNRADQQAFHRQACHNDRVVLDPQACHHQANAPDRRAGFHPRGRPECECRPEGGGRPARGDRHRPDAVGAEVVGGRDDAAGVRVLRRDFGASDRALARGVAARQAGVDRRGGRDAGLLATVLVALALVSFALEPVLARAPQYADELEAHWQTLRTWAGSHGLALPRDLDTRKLLGGNGFQSLVFGLSSAWQVLAFLLLVFFFTLLMLLEASAWRRKAFAALPAQGAAAIAIVPALARKVRRFLLRPHRPLGMISGLLAAVWLWLMGIDFAPFWGVLFFLLNYLPNIGSIIAGVPPILLAFVQFDFGWALLVAAGLLAMEQAMGNFVDPRLQGRTLNISSLVVLLSVILWGWIWAIPGALIAVPLTLTIVVGAPTSRRCGRSPCC